MTDHGPMVAVIGGGITGLAATHRLSTKGVRAVLLEKSSRLGGKVLTEKAEGFLLEAGPDSFVVGKGSVIELAAELGLTNRIISSRPEHRGSYVWWRGRLHPLPEGLMLLAPSRLGPVMRSSLLSWRGKLRLLADLVVPRGSTLTDESLESFVVRRLGREVLERIAEPLVAGIHATEPPTASMQASFPRFLEMERAHRSLILAAKAMAPSPLVGDVTSHFASFREGMGELTEALRRASTNAEIRTGSAVSRLTREEEWYRLLLGDGTELRARAVILATPAREAAALLSELVPEAAAAVAAIRQVSTATVTLAYRAEDISRLLGSGFVVPAVERRRVMGVSYLSQKWNGRVPDDRLVLLRAFVGGPHHKDLAASGEERLIGAAKEELAEMTGIEARPVLAKVQTWEGGLHQYTLGHRGRVAAAEQAVARFPGLFLAGAAFHGIGLNECVASGQHAADAVGDGLAAGSVRAPARTG